MKRYAEKWIVLWLCLVIIPFGCSKPYSDKNMQKHFIENKETFDRLIEMIKEDKTVSWIGEQFIFPADSLKLERKAQYLDLMSKANIQHIFIESRRNISGASIIKSEGKDIGRVSFGALSSFGGSLKGYTYSTQPLSPIFNSLDEPPPSLKPYEFGYKRISDDWYLHYSSQ
jgi:hypothetical protein